MRQIYFNFRSKKDRDAFISFVGGMDVEYIFTTKPFLGHYIVVIRER